MISIAHEALLGLVRVWDRLIPNVLLLLAPSSLYNAPVGPCVNAHLFETVMDA